MMLPRFSHNVTTFQHPSYCHMFSSCEVTLPALDESMMYTARTTTSTTTTATSTTVTTSSTTTTVPPCVDTTPLCPTWAAQGLCTGLFEGYTSVFCRESCPQWCSRTPPPTPQPTRAPCADNDAQCATWASKGYCTGVFQDYMATWCLVSCPQWCNNLERWYSQFYEFYFVAQIESHQVVSCSICDAHFTMSSYSAFNEVDNRLFHLTKSHLIALV